MILNESLTHQFRANRSGLYNSKNLLVEFGQFRCHFYSNLCSQEKHVSLTAVHVCSNFYWIYYSNFLKQICYVGKRLFCFTGLNFCFHQINKTKKVV